MTDLQKALQSNEMMDAYLELNKTEDIINEIKDYAETKGIEQININFPMIQKMIDDSCTESEKALRMYKKIIDNREFSRCDQFMNIYLSFSQNVANLTVILNSLKTK